MTKKKASKGAIVYLVLDKSGSMGAIAPATINGVNHFIEETAAADAKAKFSMIQFDNDIKRVHSGSDITDITPLNGNTYRPGGGTALLDAVGAAIKDVDEMADRPSKVVIVIMTDGQENGSHEYTRESVVQLVESHEKEGWQFLFLGANIDGFAEAGRIGMRAASTSSATWTPSNLGTQAAYLSMTRSTSDFLSGSTPTASLTQDNYNTVLASLSVPEGSTVDSSTAPTPTPKARSRGVAKP